MRTFITICMVLSVATLAQATTITFDDAGAGYTSPGAFGVAGATDGWFGSHATGAGYYAIDTIDNAASGSGGNEVQVQEDTWAYRDFSSDIENITTFSMLFSPSSQGGSLGGAHKELGIGPASGSNSHSGAYLWLWMDARAGNEQLLVNNGSGGGGKIGDIVENDDYRFTATLNFATQTIDATLENLTLSTTDILNGISFRTATTLAAAQTVGGSNVSLDGVGNTGNMSYDNVSVVGVPEPTSFMLVGLVFASMGSMGMKRKRA